LGLFQHDNGGRIDEGDQRGGLRQRLHATLVSIAFAGFRMGRFVDAHFGCDLVGDSDHAMALADG
jgi:hypothetical protein